MQSSSSEVQISAHLVAKMSFLLKASQAQLPRLHCIPSKLMQMFRLQEDTQVCVQILLWAVSEWLQCDGKGGGLTAVCRLDF